MGYKSKEIAIDINELKYCFLAIERTDIFFQKELKIPNSKLFGE